MVMIFSIWIQDRTAWEAFWMLGGGLIISLVVLWIDTKYVVGNELAEYMKRNPEWQKLMGQQ